MKYWLQFRKHITRAARATSNTGYAVHLGVLHTARECQYLTRRKDNTRVAQLALPPEIAEFIGVCRECSGGCAEGRRGRPSAGCVYFEKARQKWHAAGPRVGGKSKYIGAFTRREDALAARQAFMSSYRPGAS